MKIEIILADRFTIQELTDLYNQTRADYLVPMPMNADSLGIKETHMEVIKNNEPAYKLFLKKKIC